MVVAIILLLIAVGSVLFHMLSPWWWTPIASNWGYIDATIIITFWITGVVYIGIILFMAYCVWKFKKGTQAEYEPENKKLEIWLTALTAIGVAGMLAPGLFVWDEFVSVPEDAVEFEVVGQQWQWNFRLPGKDGVLGKASTQKVNYDNVLGLHQDDEHGQDDIIIYADTLHLLVDKPVKVLLRSIDVLHDFYIPQFRAKMDMVPGMVTYFWFTPTKTGTYEILCAELCGVGHHIMRGTVIVDSPADYQLWLQEQQTFSQMLAEAAGPEESRVDVASMGPKPAR